MTSEALKINITQRILNLNDNKILQKISKLLDNENIVGYDVNGDPISEKGYVDDVHEALQLFAEDKLETYSSEEVKRKIVG
jgi:hypothetical protein